MARAIELENKSLPAQRLLAQGTERKNGYTTLREKTCFLKIFNRLDPSLCTFSHFSHFTDGSDGGSGHPDPPTTAHTYPPMTERGNRYRDRLSRPFLADDDRKRNCTTGGIGDHIFKGGMPADHSRSFNAVDFYGALKGKLWPTNSSHVFCNCEKFSFSIPALTGWPLHSLQEARPHYLQLPFFPVQREAQRFERVVCHDFQKCDSLSSPGPARSGEAAAHPV